MTLWEAEMQLQTAFPNAAVHAKYLENCRKIGLGVEIEGRREGIRFNPKRTSIHAAIHQLGDLIGQRPN